MAGGLDRAHERIDELVTVVTQTATLQQRNTQDIAALTKTVAENIHGTPCPTAMDLERRIRDIEDASRQTVEVAREKGRDWRGLAFEVLKFVIIGLLCYAAGKHGIQIPTP